MESLSIVGYGGFGKEIEYLIRNKFKGVKIKIYDDLDKSANVNPIEDLVIIKKPANCIISVGDPLMRKGIYNRLKKNQFIAFPNLVFSNFETYPFDERKLIGQGNIIMGDVIIGYNTNIGSFNVIGSRVTLGHDVKLGSFNFIGPNCFLAGSVSVGDNCKLSFSTSFIQKTKMISNTNTMPFSVIYKNIKVPGTYAGNPCLKI